jgi:uncharacterized protein (TIGR00255 family)
LIKSMTAYGRSEYNDQDNNVFTAEVRSLNNRYRDIVLRIPNSLQALEEEIRSQIASRIRRGRIEVSVKFEKGIKETEYGLELNLPLARSYLRIFRQLIDELGLEGKIALDDLAQMKDIILIKPEDEDIDKIRPGLQEVLRQALDSLGEMRRKEGRAIEQDFQQRLNQIEIQLEGIRERSPIVVDEYKARLRDKIEVMIQDMEIDEGRLAQEVAIFAGRCDITEEIVRTRSHLKQFRDYMALDDAIGRRLDFLIQEMNREINTISSKASDSIISAKAVEIKSELEKLREQTQNVE